MKRILASLAIGTMVFSGVASACGSAYSSKTGEVLMNCVRIDDQSQQYNVLLKQIDAETFRLVRSVPVMVPEKKWVSIQDVQLVNAPAFTGFPSPKSSIPNPILWILPNGCVSAKAPRFISKQIENSQLRVVIEVEEEDTTPKDPFTNDLIGGCTQSLVPGGVAMVIDPPSFSEVYDIANGLQMNASYSSVHVTVNDISKEMKLP